MAVFYNADPLNCWYECTDLFKCLNGARKVFDMKCPQCKAGNRYLINDFVLIEEKNFGGTTKCQMGRTILIGREEMCDSCREEEQRKEDQYAKAREIVKENSLVQVPLALSRAMLRDAMTTHIVPAIDEDQLHGKKPYSYVHVPSTREIAEIRLGIYQVKKEPPRG